MGAGWMASMHGVQVGDHSLWVLGSGQVSAWGEDGAVLSVEGAGGERCPRPLPVWHSPAPWCLASPVPGHGGRGHLQAQLCVLAGVQRPRPGTRLGGQWCRCMPCAMPAWAPCGCWG